METKEAPAILRPALHAAVVAVADPVKPVRVAHRQRLQHHGVHEREDGGGAADAQRQCEHGRRRENASRAELAEGVDEIAVKGCSRGP